MFVETEVRPEGEVAPSNVRTLSGAIRRGLLIVQEDKKNWKFCALIGHPSPLLRGMAIRQVFTRQPPIRTSQEQRCPRRPFPSGV